MRITKGKQRYIENFITLVKHFVKREARKTINISFSFIPETKTIIFSCFRSMGCFIEFSVDAKEFFHKKYIDDIFNEVINLILKYFSTERLYKFISKELNDDNS